MPPAEPLFVTADVVARMLEFDRPSKFLKRRARLEADHGFPAPVPWIGAPLKWRRADVQAWIDGVRPEPAAADASPNAQASRRTVMLHQARRA